jgi:two-component system phosphate regulon response regulator PhoB
MANRNILVIEDEAPLLEVIKSKLEGQGFNAITVKNVEQGFKKLKELERLDVVWLDHYLLGKKTGIDFLDSLRKNRKWKDIPVFVISNTASSDKLQKYKELGARKCYVKAENRLDQIVEDISKNIN